MASLLRSLVPMRLGQEVASNSRLLNCPLLNQIVPRPPPTLSFHTSTVDEAARKGTRARREAVKKANKKKKIAEAERKKAIPLTQKELMLKYGVKPPRGDWTFLSHPPPDNVYVSRQFQWKVYDLNEAIDCHRETHHPTMYNCPDATVSLDIELSLAVDKKNRYIENINGVIPFPHSFDSGQERQIAALVECRETQERLKDLGCALVGGNEIIKGINDGDINILQYEYVVASIDIMPQVIPIRQLMKRKFPNTRNGTAVVDVEAAAEKFLRGVKYDAQKNKIDPDYADLTMPVGTLKMTNEQISENISALLKQIDSVRGTRKTSDLVTRVYMTCLKTKERFTLNHNAIIGRSVSDEHEAVIEEGESSSQTAVAN